MRGVFSTADVAPKDRFAYWSDLVCDTFVCLDCRSPVAKSFNASMRYGALDWLRVVEAESAEIEGVRSRYQISKGQEDDLLVSIQISGEMRVAQDGRRSVVAPGDIVLCDSRRPYSLQMQANNRAVWLQFPRKELTMRVGATSPFVATAISGRAGVAALFLQLACALPQRAPEFHDAEPPALAAQTLDLLALVLSHRAGKSVSLSSSKVIALERLKRTIGRNLRDPELNPFRAAEMAGIGVRQANRLLALERTSLERFIFSERLDRCYAALLDTAHDNQTISEIAFSWGFNDLSHFSRSFRTHFGMSPTEFRKHSRSTGEL